MDSTAHFFANLFPKLSDSKTKRQRSRIRREKRLEKEQDKIDKWADKVISKLIKSYERGAMDPQWEAPSSPLPIRRKILLACERKGLRVHMDYVIDRTFCTDVQSIEEYLEREE